MGPKEIKDINPTYVLCDLILNKPIRYYALTEADQIDVDSENYLAEHPGYTMADLHLIFDKWGLSVPIVGIDEFL